MIEIDPLCKYNNDDIRQDNQPACFLFLLSSSEFSILLPKLFRACSLSEPLEKGIPQADLVPDISLLLHTFSFVASVFRNFEKNQILWYFSRKLCQEAVNHLLPYLLHISVTHLYNSPGTCQQACCCHALWFPKAIAISTCHHQITSSNCRCEP